MDFGAWLRPTLFGPFLTMWTLATVSALLGAQQMLLGYRFDSWVTAMLIGSFLASGMAVLLLTADVVLLKWKKRMLPMGQRAWTSSCATPLATMGLWSVWPGPVDSVAWIAVAIVVPMIAAAFGMRFLLGKRI